MYKIVNQDPQQHSLRYLKVVGKQTNNDFAFKLSTGC